MTVPYPRAVYPTPTRAEPESGENLTAGETPVLSAAGGRAAGCDGIRPRPAATDPACAGGAQTQRVSARAPRGPAGSGVSMPQNTVTKPAARIRASTCSFFA